MQPCIFLTQYLQLKIESPKPHRPNSMPAASRGCALRRGCWASLSHGSRTCRDISNRDTFPTARIFLSQFSKHARSQRPGHFVALGSSVAKMEFGNVIQAFRPSNWPASYHRASSVRSRNLSSGTASMGFGGRLIHFSCSACGVPSFLSGGPCLGGCCSRFAPVVAAAAA